MREKYQDILKKSIHVLTVLIVLWFGQRSFRFELIFPKNKGKVIKEYSHIKALTAQGHYDRAVEEYKKELDHMTYLVSSLNLTYPLSFCMLNVGHYKKHRRQK